jgi:hypothetical protein
MSEDERPIRWHAVVHYRTDDGTIDVEHDVEELGELHDLIERGPHWDTIERIEVLRVNPCAATDLTVEQAAGL